MADDTLVRTLREQATDIAQRNINGWGNTMTWAADEIEELTARLAQFEEHERETHETHETLGAILGTDTSLEDGARRLQARVMLLEKRIAQLRIDLQQVLVTTDEVHSLSKLYEAVRLVARVGLAEDDKIAQPDEGGQRD